jgi:hypothetical protein
MSTVLRVGTTARGEGGGEDFAFEAIVDPDFKTVV